MAILNQAEKLNKISQLDYSAIQNLMKTLIEKKGFSNIVSNDECISAEQSGLLGKNTSIFITFPFKLGGSLPKSIDEIANKIRQCRNNYSANSVYVYSQMVISNGFQTNLNEKFSSAAPSYLGRDEIVELVDSVLNDFWRHEDISLIKYEKDLVSYLEQDNDLRKLKFPNEKYSKLANIFIEPHLIRYYENPQTKTAVQKKFSMTELISHDESLIIDGPAGFGKSTLLKSIARNLIEQNDSGSEKKNFPIFVSTLEIFESEFNIHNVILKKIGNYTEASFRELSDEYKVHLLIDSIDEFDESIPSILNQLAEIEKKYKVKYYIATRNSEIIASKSPAKLSTFSIRRFNLTQIKLFLNAFFSGDEGKCSSLLDAIRDNQMIERLPMSPLTISLLSILFEEKELEIPATISDIYDNFNTLIIGKAIVSSKIEFIDISFKERIISIYAYELLKDPNHIPFTKNKFIDFFKSYYDGKTLPIKRGVLEDVLEYLINNTGILYLKDGERVLFTHDSYMEYYSALEIFKHQRKTEEAKLIDNFLDPHWQSAAVFYAGMSKDMPDFLNDVKQRISESSNIGDFMSAILGIGYLLQASYQTDNTIRKDLVVEALRLSLENLRVFKMMAADDYQLFKNYNLPILTLINFIYFYESFNSITLGEPLKLAFSEKIMEFNNNKDVGIGYNLLELAITMASKRIQNDEPLTQVIGTSELVKEPILNILANFSLEILGKERYKDYISELKKVSASLSDVQRSLIQLPMSKLRFTALDNIKQNTKVTLLVEGVTDATVFEHAYMVLTNGTLPYWNITSAGPKRDKNSCAEVAKTLTQSYANWKLEPESVFIGIFDHDAAGLGCFRGNLDPKIFDEQIKDFIKKHNEANIFGLCIPIPGEMDNYLQSKQEFNFFEMEHYFGEDLLRENSMLVESGIPGIYQIADSQGKKTSFAKKVKEWTDPKVFEHFLLLFKKIDELAGVKVNYSV